MRKKKAGQYAHSWRNWEFKNESNIRRHDGVPDFAINVSVTTEKLHKKTRVFGHNTKTRLNKKKNMEGTK